MHIAAHLHGNDQHFMAARAQGKMKARTPAITPNQLVFAVIRGMKRVNFNPAIPILAQSNELEMLGIESILPSQLHFQLSQAPRQSSLLPIAALD
jgi:hypothetical protein